MAAIMTTYQVSFHLLYLDLDCVQGITEHLALFCNGGGLHDDFPEYRASGRRIRDKRF